MSIEILFFIVIILSVLNFIFPQVSLATLIIPRIFFKIDIFNQEIVLTKPFEKVNISIDDVVSISLAPWYYRLLMGANLTSALTMKITTTKNSYFITKSPVFNLGRPAIEKDMILQIISQNNNIKLDDNLESYIKGSLADLYINKHQIFRGLLSILIIIVFFLILGLISMIWK